MGWWHAGGTRRLFGPDTVVSVIKDAFIRLQLSLQNCRGQCYDGASNMLGKRSGVAKQIQDIQKKAHPTHCHAHSLSLSVKDATSHCKILSDTVNNTNEIVKLVKFSPKRENLLGQFKSNIEMELKMKKKAFQHPAWLNSVQQGELWEQPVSKESSTILAHY